MRNPNGRNKQDNLIYGERKNGHYIEQTSPNEGTCVWCHYKFKGNHYPNPSVERGLGAKTQ
jgi:hypothetical protein